RRRAARRPGSGSEGTRRGSPESYADPGTERSRRRLPGRTQRPFAVANRRCGAEYEDSGGETNGSDESSKMSVPAGQRAVDHDATSSAAKNRFSISSAVT